jgi:RNA polymerase sigma-70 factor (ECF subfamily)
MSEEQTTAVVQRYLEALAGDTPAEPTVRALLDRAVGRLQLLCANLLRRSYPRLMQPPLNLEPDELLGAVVKRLLKALRAVRPTTVRQFFALANQLVRIQGLTQAEAAEVLGVSAKTVQRRLNRGLVLLEEQLDDLRPD